MPLPSERKRPHTGKKETAALDGPFPTAQESARAKHYCGFRI